MKYSFVIPTYNNRVLLKNTLEALNYQPGYGYYEVIVVDDGSTDNSGEYIKGVNRNYDLKYFYLERGKDSCRAKCRNHGWKQSAGEIIVFIDSDIVVRPDYLSELNRCFSMKNDIAVIGNRLLLNTPTTYEEIIRGDIFTKNRFDNRNFDILEYRYFFYESASYNNSAIMFHGGRSLPAIWPSPENSSKRLADSMKISKAGEWKILPSVICCMKKKSLLS